MTGLLVAAFAIFAILGVPIAFAFGLSALAGLLWAGMPFNVLAEKMVFSVDSFPLMAIPFFMLAGELMVEGGIMQRLVALANAVVGNIRGGLAQSCVLSGVGLSMVSGTAVADAVALNAAMGRPMAKAYGVPFSSGVIAAAANLGPIIPPSTPMILYATLAGSLVPVSDLFAAGFIPGLLIGLGMMVAIYIIAVRRGYPRTGSAFSFGVFLTRLRQAFLVLLMPVVVIGGIVFGAFTATEGGAIAVAYALLAGFLITRTLRFKALPGIFLRAVVTSAVVGALIAFASPLTFLFSISGIPELIGDFFRDISAGPTAFLLAVFVMLVIVGIFIEPASAYILLVPIFAPMAPKFGIDSIHFATVFILTLIIGMLTPPVGALLFVMTGVNKISLGTLSRELIPFIAIQFGVVVAIIFWPDLATWLPQLIRNL